MSSGRISGIFAAAIVAESERIPGGDVSFQWSIYKR